jgi:hypothetical protein
MNKSSIRKLVVFITVVVLLSVVASVTYAQERTVKATVKAIGDYAHAVPVASPNVDCIAAELIVIGPSGEKFYQGKMIKEWWLRPSEKEKCNVTFEGVEVFEKSQTQMNLTIIAKNDDEYRITLPPPNTYQYYAPLPNCNWIGQCTIDLGVIKY